MFFGLMRCPGMPLASLRQKHFFTTDRSRTPTCLRWQFIIKEGLSALTGDSARVPYAEEQKLCSCLIQADDLRIGIVIA